MSPSPAIAIEPIGTVRSARREIADDDWGAVRAEIELAPGYGPEALAGLEEFSHVEVTFHFDRVDPGAVERGARHPRGNRAWPRVGIFAQRAKDRPNRLGVSIAAVVEVRGTVLVVQGLDAVDGTPVVDIKPVIAEFLPRGPMRQPGWATELMRDYWSTGI